MRRASSARAVSSTGSSAASRSNVSCSERARTSPDSASARWSTARAAAFSACSRVVLGAGCGELAFGRPQFVAAQLQAVRSCLDRRGQPDFLVGIGGEEPVDRVCACPDPSNGCFELEQLGGRGGERLVAPTEVVELGERTRVHPGSLAAAGE